jgi:hypothetical protein
MFRIQSTPDFSVAEHYGLRNTTCLYSKDVASVHESGGPGLLFNEKIETRSHNKYVDNFCSIKIGVTRKIRTRNIY